MADSGSFYDRFAAHYERVFPLREGTLAFLQARLPAGGAVLDLGCGPGHYCGALAAAGLDVVGIDLDPAMIAAARARYPAARFEVLDLRDVARLAPPLESAARGAASPPLAGAYCIGNVLPHLAPDDLAAFLPTLHDVLAPGAPFVVQTVNFDRLLPLDEPHRFPDIDAGGGLVFRREYVPGERGSVRFVTELREGEVLRFAGEERLWPQSSRDLIDRCRAGGFALREHRGDFAGAAFDPAASAASVLAFETGNCPPRF